MSKIALVVDSSFGVSETGLSLKELQTAVDGLIQPIDITESLTMWVNEEFLFRSEPDPNTVGTVFFSEVGGSYDIHGTVVFTGGTDPEGATLGLGLHEIELINTLATYGKSFRLKLESEDE